MQINRSMNAWADALDPKYRYIFLKGGRASSKSHEAAGYISERSFTETDLKIVCLREVQKSLKFSSKSLIEEKLKNYEVLHHYRPTRDELRKHTDDGLMLFQGMSDLTADNAKSLEGFALAWFEEAKNASQKSITTLKNTIRSEGAQVIFSWNPENEDDPIEKFCNEMADRDDVLVIHVNYDQNAFLSSTIKREIEEDRVRYPEDFDHIWLGGYNTRSDVRVFNRWSVEECAPTFDDTLYYGLDFGFSQDPTSGLRAWVNEQEKKVYIDYQVDGLGIETDHLPELLDRVPDSRKYTWIADCARPETISYLNRHGFIVKGSKKGAGSVESGVDWLRGYEIIIHPRCKLLEKELRLYSYKVDRAGNILPKLEDANNHCIDALRYALESIIKQESGGGFIEI